MSLFPSLLFTPRSSRRDKELSPTAARAPDCNRNSFVNYRILRPRATSAAPSNVGFAREPRDGRDDRPPVLPTQARTYSLTLDTVPSIQRYFSIAFARHDHAPLIDTSLVLRSLAGGARHVDTDGNRLHHDERVFVFAEEFQEELIMLFEAAMIMS